MKSHQYIAAGFFAAAISFLPLGAFAQTAPQPSASATTEPWTVTKYISTQKQDRETASRYLIDCLNNILKDLDSPVNSDGSPRTDKQIKSNHNLGKFINRFFAMDASGASHYRELAGFMAQVESDGEGKKTVESAIYSYLSLTLRTQKAADSNPDSAAEKPR